jgi:hypothetical protein
MAGFEAIFTEFLYPWETTSGNGLRLLPALALLYVLGLISVLPVGVRLV